MSTINSIKELELKAQKPGIYFDMPNDTYHADCSLSNSGMGKLLQSPIRYWYDSPMNPHREPLDTMAIKNGRALHTLLLEPHKFEEEWEIKPNVQNTTLEGKIGEGAFKDLQNAITSLRNDKIINNLFVTGFPEVSIFWIDEKTGVPCRARMDYLTIHFISDLKGVANINDYALGNSIVDYGYYRQAAFYLDGIAIIQKLLKDGNCVVDSCPNEAWLEKFLTAVYDKFIFVWQEKKPPYITRADQLCERTLEVGTFEYREALQIFKNNYELYGNKPWPSGYQGGVGLIQLDDLPARICYKT